MSTNIASGQARMPNWGDYLGLLETERLEIQKVKWIHSERLGHDVGWDYAVWIWETTDRKRWLEKMRQEGKPTGLG